MFYGSKGYCRSDTHGHQAGKAIYQTLTASARNTFMAILVSRYATWVKNLPRISDRHSLSCCRLFVVPVYLGLLNIKEDRHSLLHFLFSIYLADLIFFTRCTQGAVVNKITKDRLDESLFKKP